MYLTGYHGTTSINANNIIKEGNFKISNSDVEWLGDGIYYYFDINDAYEWRNSEVILHSVIKIEDKEYLDIDSDVGKKIYNQIIEYISDMQGKSVNRSFESIQKNQCAVMKMLWQTNPNIKVISASFPAVKTKLKTLLDTRPTRKEFCVRNNSYIKCTQLIRKDDLND